MYCKNKEDNNPETLCEVKQCSECKEKELNKN